jgi:hypothetical protein
MLKHLVLFSCRLDDECTFISLTTLWLEILNINSKSITSAGLDDITRMIESMPQLTTTGLHSNNKIFMDKRATQHFVSTLQQKKSSTQELPWVSDYLPVNIRPAT